MFRVKRLRTSVRKVRLVQYYKILYFMDIIIILSVDAEDEEEEKL